MLRLKSAKLALTSFFLAAVFTGAAVFAKAPAWAAVDTAITVAALPQQGLQTYHLIHQGGPFAHEKDGTVFGNRERLLPLHTRGYYREYTVATPNLRARGARRIVCGGAPKTPDACYYTADHYGSFRRIVP